MQGNPAIDMTLLVNKAMLKQLNLLGTAEGWKKDITEKKRIIEFVKGHKDVKITCGGSALNTIRIAKLVGGNDLSAAFIGRIGIDNHGEFIKSICRNESINSAWVQEDELENTAVCAILVDEDSRDRFIVCLRQAAGKLSLEAALHNPDFCQAIENPNNLVFATSYNLTTENRVQLINYVFSNCKAKRALSLSSESILNTVRQHLKELLPKCDFVFGNAHESMHWAKMCNQDSVSLESSVELLSSMLRKGGLAVITNSSGPYCIAVNGKPAKKIPLPFQAEVKGDTNGAGDAFTGGFLASIATSTQDLNHSAADLTKHVHQVIFYFFHPKSIHVPQGHKWAAMKLRYHGMPNTFEKKLYHSF